MVPRAPRSTSPPSRALLVVALGSALIAPFVHAAPAASARPGDAAGEPGAWSSIHAESSLAHARDPNRFVPGGRVRVALQAAPGNGVREGAAAPPAGRLAGREMLEQQNGAVARSSHQARPPRDTTGATDMGPHGALSEPLADPTPIATSEPTPDPTPDPTPEPVPPPVRLADREVFGYLPYWELYDASTRLDLRTLTTIAYFGIGAHQDGYLIKQSGGRPTTQWAGWTSTRMTSLIEDAHAAGVRVVLTVERFSWQSGQADRTTALLSDPARRLALAAEIAQAVRDRGADGVNLDFEPIPSAVREEFVLFVHEVRAALDLHSTAYQLTYAATAYVGNYDVEALSADGAADAVFIMGYEFRGSTAARSGATAPLTRQGGYDLTEAVAAFVARSPPDKVILGLPWYGRAWSTETDLPASLTRQDPALYGSSSAVTYAEVVPRAVASRRRFEAASPSAWSAYIHRACASCPDTWRQVWYDDVESLGAKYGLVRDAGLRGAGIWALGYDGTRPELATLLRLAFDDGVDLRPPTGSVVLEDGAVSTTSSRVRLTLTAQDDGALDIIRVTNVDEVGTELAPPVTFPWTRAVDWELHTGAPLGEERGPRSVRVEWRDVAGKWSAPASDSIEFLGGRPEADVSIAGGVAATASTIVDVVVEQTGGRAIDTVRLSNNAATGADGRLTLGSESMYGASVAWSLVDEATGGVDADGEKHVWVQWRDSSGAWSAPVARSIVLDRQAPAGTSVVVAGGAAATADAEVALDLAANDRSGVAEVRISGSAVTEDGVLRDAMSAPVAARVTWSLTDPTYGGTASDGVHRVHAQWRDGAGNWSPVVTASIVLDRVAPAVGPVSLRSESGARLRSDGGVPVLASWTATDATTTVTATTLEHRSGSGAWVWVPLASPAATSASLFVPAGPPQRVRASAVDAVGNGAAAQTAALTFTLLQEDAAALVYTGSWRRVASGAGSGGSVMTSSTKGAAAQLSFTGREVAVVARRTSTSGKARVYLDGALVTTVDLRSASNTARVVVFRAGWAIVGTHRLELRVMGTPSGPRVDLDAVVVGT